MFYRHDSIVLHTKCSYVYILVKVRGAASRQMRMIAYAQ